MKDSAEISRLDANLRAAEAVRAVKRLQHALSHYLEFGLWSDIGDLFTEHSTAEFHFRAGDRSVSGKASIQRHFMAQAERTASGIAHGQLNSHLIMQPIITLGAGGTTAQGTWHEVTMLGRFGVAASWRGGVYENEYAFDGAWKISALRYYEQYAGAYDDWGHKAPPKWNIPYHFEAAHVGVTIPESALQSLAASASASSHTRLSALAQRVRRMSDETLVQNLQHSYGYYLDRKLWDDAADLFAENGTLEIAGCGGYVGRPRIRSALEALYGAPPLRRGEMFDHINLATVVTIAADGRSARARTTQLAMLGLNGQSAQWELGIYENEFIKDGSAWKITAVRYFPRLATDYDAGWAKDIRPPPAPSATLPPDRAPAEYKSYPSVQPVPLHFANPVTGAKILAAQGAADSDIALTDLVREIDAAIAVDAVENLNSSYGYYIDESAWDHMADTFASTGSKEITGAGVYVGPDRIRHILNLRGPRGGRTPNFFTIHQLVQPVIHISEEGGSAKARMRLFQCGGNADGSSGSWIGGIYENTAVKENGEWKFGVQDLHHLFNASYRNGWARAGGVTFADAPATGRNTLGGGITQGLGGAYSPAKFAAEFPPDYPIRAKQYAFPEIVEPAFHYTNPVTGRRPKDFLP